MVRDSVDLTNAFPLVHRATLWNKLRRLGAGGKIFDFLRQVYCTMKYKVRHGEKITEEFLSDMGILIGDTLSPFLWILYFHDFGIPETGDDVELFGIYISHLEQADDLLLLALSPEGLQWKMDQFYAWCARNFMIINALKSFVAYHGPEPTIWPEFYFAESLVEIVGEYTYMGSSFQSGNHRIFMTTMAPHYTNKAAKARKVANAILHIESMIRSVPPNEGRILYSGCVDPHLTFGCETALDSSTKDASALEKVQHDFLKRLLGLSKNVATVTLFTETGLTPILFRRMELALRYLAYALQRPVGTYVHAAVNESIRMYENERISKGWFTDLMAILKRNLSEAVKSRIPTPDEFRDPKMCQEFRDEVRRSKKDWFRAELERTQAKTYLLLNRREPRKDGEGYGYVAMCLRKYLVDIWQSRYRKAFTKLICGDHPLAVERLRWTDNHRVQVLHEERICRFCREQVETPEHALLRCKEETVVQMRHKFLTAYQSLDPHVYRQIARVGDLSAVLAEMVSYQPAYSLVAKYIHDVLKYFEGTPLLVPPQYRR